MFVVKKCLMLLLSTTLFASGSSFAMFDPNQDELPPSSAASSLNLTNPEDTYMVHLSRIMSENSTKIAGGMLLGYDPTTLDLKKVTIHAEGSMIRSRITLHHCFGGVVPECTHGLPVDTLFGKVKLPSDLYTNKDVCAYLDPLSEFKGELLGGFPEDMMSIDRHIYKNKSIVVIPNHRVEEFKAQNPHFLGRTVQFDSNKTTVAEKVEELISQSLNQISIKKLHKNIDIEMKERKFDTLNNIEKIFTSNGLRFCSHENTAFRAMEHLFNPLNKQISAGYEKNNHMVFLEADQVSSRLAMIRSLLDTALESSLGSLNDEKKSAMKSWQQDTLNWLNLFELDAKLRQKFDTTLFIDNPRLGTFVKNRANKEKLYILSNFLAPIEEKEELKRNSLELFPELTLSDLVSGPGWKDFIQHTDFQLLLKLKDNLVKEGYSQQGHGLILIRLLNRIADSIGKGFSIKDNEIEHLQNALKGLHPSSRLQANILPMIKNILWNDNSYKNKTTLKLLNSSLGKFFQEKIWENNKQWAYEDLLLQCEDTRILFADLDTLNVKDHEKEFIDIVRRWMLEQTSKESRETSALKIRIKEGESWAWLKNARFSVSNIRKASNMADALNGYRLGLGFSFMGKDHPFNILIEQGCFASWPELLNSILPLEDLTSAEIKGILQNPTSQFFGSNSMFYTPNFLYRRVNDYKKEKEKSLRFYQEEVEKYKAEAESLYQFSPNKTTEPCELSAVFEKLIYGIERDIPCGLNENKIIIPPNWGRAWDLYDKTLVLVGSIKWRTNQLKRWMQPIFDKALTVKYTQKNDSH